MCSSLQIILSSISSFILALILSWIQQKATRRKKEKEQEQLYISVLHSIYYDFKKNTDLLCQLHAYLFVKMLPSFSLELSRRNTLIQTLVPVCSNVSLLDHIYDGYFELVHIQERLDQFRQAYGTQHIDTLRRGTYALITNDIRRIFEILSEIAEEANTRSVTGEKIDKLPEDYLAKKFQEFQEDPDVVSIAARQGIELSNRDRFDINTPARKTQASGAEAPMSGSYD